MSRAQCLVHRGEKILMVQHSWNGEEWWCLPGGGIEKGETPEMAALRELKEECCVEGRLIRRTSVIEYESDDHYFTFLVDIGNQTPQLGDDPDKEEGKKILSGIGWFALRELSEVDRAFTFGAGLLTVPTFEAEVLSWRRESSYPSLKTNA